MDFFVVIWLNNKNKFADVSFLKLKAISISERGNINNHVHEQE
jgi:hypothetical protein